MKKWLWAVIATVVSFLLAAGMFAAFALTARATNGPECRDTSSALTCSVDDTDIAYPEQLTDEIWSTPGSVAVNVTWHADCYDANDRDWQTSYTGTVTTPADTPGQTTTAIGESVTLGTPDPVYCSFTSTVTASSSNTVTVSMVGINTNWIEQVNPTATIASPTPSPSSPAPSAPAATPSPSAARSTVYDNQVRGFDGRCLDDAKNSAAERTKVVIWACGKTDQAQGWRYTADELKIHGMCLNAKGNGKSGSKIILWTCDNSGNEIWIHRPDGEFVEQSNGRKLCLEDPAYSTANGTQAMVSACTDGTDQRWSEP